jgi:hypothetical protein
MADLSAFEKRFVVIHERFAQSGKMIASPFVIDLGEELFVIIEELGCGSV